MNTFDSFGAMNQALFGTLRRVAQDTWQWEDGTFATYVRDGRPDGEAVLPTWDPRDEPAMREKLAELLRARLEPNAVR